ncbi:MAG: hypothetical protein HDR17_10755 [Lachnospiraceae bacterium]|nr:hypothetical protein [Lachnospiraceae bacterium]MBD5502698.1 hypothetical protein [Lachnospiraceae bacterium]MBD5506228.1 hypothetical protein [Lachnospiraceae bacterium]
MSEWDFLWGLEGDELMDAMASGGTEADWEYIEEQEKKRRQNQRRKNQWEELKSLRDTKAITKEEFKRRKVEIFS